MRNPFLRSRRDLVAQTPLLAGAAATLANRNALAQSGQDVTWQFDPLDNIRGNPDRVGAQPKVIATLYFKGAVMRAHFAPRAPAPSEFTKVPASLASWR